MTNGTQNVDMCSLTNVIHVIEINHSWTINSMWLYNATFDASFCMCNIKIEKDNFIICFELKFTFKNDVKTKLSYF
jgi:hypothetical protein